MASGNREGRLAALFVTMADTLVADYDIVELLQTMAEECASLLDVADVGIVLADSDGRLQMMASSSQRGGRVEALQLAMNDGPCVECFTVGSVVEIEELSADEERWPAFREFAVDQGLRSVHAVPLRLRDLTIGALNLFREQPGRLNPDDAAAAQALADVATIGILQERAIRDRTVVAEQLQHALESRVLIEQAKGVVAQARNIQTEEAFQWLRTFARGHNARLRDVAEAIIERRLPV